MTVAVLPREAKLSTMSPACTRGCWWLARLVTFGRNRNGDVLPRWLGPRFAEQLGRAPVRFYRDHTGELAHPTGPFNLEHMVGWIDSAWSDDRAVYGVIHLASPDAREPLLERLRRGMLALERDGLLSRNLAVSLAWRGHVSAAFECGRDVRHQIDVTGVTAVDFVTMPACDTSVLRSLHPTKGAPR